MLNKTGLWQAVSALMVSLLACGLAGLHGGFSALLGSMAVWVGSALGMLSMRQADKNKKANAGSALLLLLRAEAIKIVVIALLLLITFKVYVPGLVPLALIAGLAVAALLAGVGIGRAGEEQG